MYPASLLTSHTLIQSVYGKIKKKKPQFSQSERDELAILRKKGYSFRDIAKALGRSFSALCTEVNRNKTKNVYDPSVAQQKAILRRRNSKFQGMKIVEHPALQTFVEEKLYDDQSPANIAGRIQKHEHQLPYVSRESIYRYIGTVYGRNIERYRNGRRSKRRTHGRTRSVKLDGRIFIDKRPISIGKRARIGDAESDFIVSGRSGKGILLVVIDRKSRTPFVEQIIDGTIENVHKAFQRIKKRYPELHTITTDNDILLRKHKELELLLGVKIYFCHPYHSWEKGSVEHVNGIIRKDIPKGSDISKYSKKFIRAIEKKLQRTYMECLDYKTPYEVLTEYRKQKRRRSVKKK